MGRIEEYVSSRRNETLEELKELLRIPTVSTSRAAGEDMARCAELVALRLEKAGLKARLLQTGGHPAAYGEWISGRHRPTVLVYGHYDVQPPDPLELWRYGPFDPTEEGGCLFARGASDDKGQFYALVKGIEACIRTSGDCPVNVKVLIEGEEEIGSPGLAPLMERDGQLLSNDVVFVADGSQFAAGVPAITYGLRGLAYLELIVRGPSKDLHSGVYGGAVPNPANILARMLAACQGPFGKVGIPDFYNRVRELEPWERQAFADLPFDEAQFRAQVGAPGLWGEEGYTTLERKWTRPTFDVNGIVSGFTEEGTKTVLPSVARAKVSMRLVPDQDPEEVVRLTRDFLQSMVPSCVALEIVVHHLARPVMVPRDGKAVRAAMSACVTAFGRAPVFIREGGSIPVVSTLQQRLGAQCLLFGLGSPDDDAHAPNEKLRIEDFYRGMVLMGTWLEEMGG